MTNGDYQNARRRERYATDPEYQERIKAQTKKWRAANPRYRELMNARARERYATDPEYRERKDAQTKKWLAANPHYREQKNTRERENRRQRRATDPEYRERENTRESENRRQRRATDPEYREHLNAQRREAHAAKRTTMIERLRARQDNKDPFTGKELPGFVHINHILPKAKGGTNDDWNLCLVAPEINLKLKDKFTHDAACYLMYQLEQTFGSKPYPASARQANLIIIFGFAIMRLTGQWPVNFPI